MTVLLRGMQEYGRFLAALGMTVQSGAMQDNGAYPSSKSRLIRDDSAVTRNAGVRGDSSPRHQWKPSHAVFRITTEIPRFARDDSHSLSLMEREGGSLSEPPSLSSFTHLPLSFRTDPAKREKWGIFHVLQKCYFKQRWWGIYKKYLKDHLINLIMNPVLIYFSIPDFFIFDCPPLHIKTSDQIASILCLYPDKCI